MTINNPLPILCGYIWDGEVREYYIVYNGEFTDRFATAEEAWKAYDYWQTVSN